MPERQEGGKMKTRITFGFRGKNQLPVFTVIKEFIEDGETVFAKILFEIKGRKYKKEIRKWQEEARQERADIKYWYGEEDHA
jgi:hypothetical protein